MNRLKNKTFVFAGNRAFVFQKMIKLGLNIKKIFTPKDSYLEKYLINSGIEFELIEDKKTFVENLKKIDFDYLISNGLHLILPISELKKGNNKQFINIHPSYLPDLRGMNPPVGALLYKKDTGATCHYMDDGIDTGNIISQIKIPYSPDLDAGLLYQLLFIAEGDVFQEAYEKEFKSELKQVKKENDIYYSFKTQDMDIDLEKNSVDEIINKAKAFSIKSKGANIEIEKQQYKVFAADVIQNEYANSLLKRYKNLEVMFKYENFIVLKKDDKCLRLNIVAI